MVDGVHMVFSKKKMIERVSKEGLGNLLNEEILKIMDNLDGMEVGSNSWNRQVKGEPVYTCRGKDGKSSDVNEEDCVSISDWKKENIVS